MFHPAVVAATIAAAGSIAPVSPGPCLFVAASSAATYVLFFARRRAISFTLLLLLFVVCGTRANGALLDFERGYVRALHAIDGPRRCAGIFEVTASPTLRIHGDQDNEALLLWTGVSDDLDCEGRRFSGPVSARLYGGPDHLARGDRVEVIAQLAPIRLFRNAGLSNPWPGAARRGPVLSGSTLVADRSVRGDRLASAIDRARAFVRVRIMKTFNSRAEPMGRALVLGENDLEGQDAEAFRQSGLLHLLAVSGTHLVIAVLGIVRMLRGILVRVTPLSRRYDVARLSAGLGAVASIGYADFSGGSGSAWRAAFMLCLVCGGRAIGFKLRGATALGWSLLCGLAVDPLAGADYSFLLSALATAGLIGLGQPLARFCCRGFFARAPLRPLVESLAATVSSTLPCSPVLAMMDDDMTGAALFANVVAAPLGEVVALPACLLHTIASPWPSLEKGLALVGSGALIWVREVALWSASVEKAQFPVPFPSAWNIATGCTVVMALSLTLPSFARLFGITSGRVRIWLFVATCVAAVTLGTTLRDDSEDRVSSSSEYSSARPSLVVTALDVGQGDALFVDFPDGSKALVDGGGFATGRPDPGERVILPYLRARGIEKLDLVVLSHPHPDHLLGLLSVLAEIPVGRLWIPGAGVSRHGKLGELITLAEARGASTIPSDALCKRGAFSWGGASVEVLAPCFPLDPPLGANDASLVLRVSHGRHRALFTGDIEQRGEQQLLQTSRANLAADYLKVAHHGSDTSSDPAFIDAVRPNVAVISSGVRNRFDHPRKKTLDTLRARNIAILRTDRLGSITWRSDGRSASLSSFSWAPPGEAAPRFRKEIYGAP